MPELSADSMVVQSQRCWNADVEGSPVSVCAIETRNERFYVWPNRPIIYLYLMKLLHAVRQPVKKKKKIDIDSQLSTTSDTVSM